MEKNNDTSTGNSFTLTEIDAKDAPVKDIQWEGRDVEAAPRQLVDDGSGAPIVIRSFQYQLPEGMPSQPTKEQLLSYHKGRILPFLWKDELTPIGDDAYKLVYAKEIGKESTTKFSIFVTCKPKAGSIIYQKPNTIREITNETTGHSD